MSTLIQTALAREAELEPVREQGWFSTNSSFSELGDEFVRAGFRESEDDTTLVDMLRRAIRAYEHAYCHEKIHVLRKIIMEMYQSDMSRKELMDFWRTIRL
jgi:hypothetical protein